jgi:hypothetical protein
MTSDSFVKLHIYLKFLRFHGNLSPALVEIEFDNIAHLMLLGPVNLALYVYWQLLHVCHRLTANFTGILVKFTQAVGMNFP